MVYFSKASSRSAWWLFFHMAKSSPLWKLKWLNLRQQPKASGKTLAHVCYKFHTHLPLFVEVLLHFERRIPVQSCPRSWRSTRAQFSLDDVAIATVQSLCTHWKPDSVLQFDSSRFKIAWPQHPIYAHSGVFAYQSISINWKDVKMTSSSSASSGWSCVSRDQNQH